MRITIVQGPFLPVPPLMGGAIEKFFYPLAQLWASQGHTVTHISRAYKDLPTRQVANGVTYIRVPSHSATRNGLLNKFFDFDYSLRVLKVLPEADILVTHTFFLPILATHPERHGEVYVHVARFPKGQLSLYGKAAALQFQSQSILDAALSQAPQLRAKFRLIPNAIPFDPPPFHERPIPTLPLKLLYVGRVHPEKGLKLFLEALGLLSEAAQRQISLSIIGPHATSAGGGGEAYLAELKALAAKLASRVEFLGPVFDLNVLGTHYAQSDLFIYPSQADFGEASPFAPLEALAYGTPILVSKIGCFDGYLRPNENGFVFDHHAADPAQALADKLSEILAKRAEFPALSVCAAATAQNFTLEQISNRFIKDFETLL